MKIAFLSPTFPPYPGGIGMNAYYNALEMRKRGFDVQVFTPKYSRESLSELKTKNERIKISSDSLKISSVISEPKAHYLRPFFSYGKAAFLPQLLWRLRGFDIVHLYYPFFGGAEVAVFAHYFFKSKLILHHEMDAVGEAPVVERSAFTTGYSWQKKIFSFHTRYILPWILKNTDLLFVLSEDYFQNSDLGQLYKKLKNPPPYEIVPNGVDTEHFKPMLPTQLLTTNYSLPTVIFAAGLDKAHYFKGVSVLLETMNILKKENFNCRLFIAGEGESKKNYEALARKLDLQDSISFVGLVTHENLPQFYSQGNVFVMPSVGRTESFSIATAEAQACGLPAIVSDLPGMRVTIENNITGFLVKPGQAQDLAEKIKIILSNVSLARKMGQAGRERMEKLFSWKVIGERLEKMYYSLITKRI